MPESATAQSASSALNSILPVASLVLGWFLNELSDHFRHRRERRDQIAERRAEFQQDTILALQEAVLELGRSATQIHVQDMKHVAETGAWHTQKIPAELDEKERLAHARAAMLAVRLRDDKLRELVSAFKNVAVEVAGGSDTPASCAAAFIRMTEINEKLQLRIGELLKALHDEESKLVN